MTLYERNTFLKTGIIFCGVITLLVIAVSILALPVYPAMDKNSFRPAYLTQNISGAIFNTDYFSVHVSISLSVLFSLLTLILIHSYFERTNVQEILYIAFFTFSLSLEAVRLIVPLHFLHNFPMFYLMIAARVLIFARYFAIFSLFAAGLCASGLEVQRTRNIILFIFVPSLIIAIGVPIDGLTWDTSFVLVNGYKSMFTMVEFIIFITTVINFFIAIKKRNSKEYLYVGIGVAIAMAGRYILIGTDNWAGPIAGTALLSFGIWFVCSKLHKIHLWL